MSDRWFFRHRQGWIAQMLRVYGFINRIHIERMFGVSTPQASVDLQTFMKENPGSMAYNSTTKRYEACNDPL